MKGRTFVNVSAPTGVAALAPTPAQEAAIRCCGRLEQGLWQTNLSADSSLDLDAMCSEVRRLGMPTRNEIDCTQEINNRCIAEVIADLEYDGHVCRAWRPTPGRDVTRSIEKAIAIVDV